MKKLLSLLFIISVATSYAQQEAQFTQYMFNTNAINPAYTGSRDAISVLAFTRKQWVGFDGAPETQTFNINSPILNNKLASGFTLMTDKIGPIQQTGAYADFAYRIKLKDAHLAFGLKAGIDIIQGAFSNLSVINNQDQNFQNNMTSRALPNFGFGVYYHSDRYFVGLSTPKLVEKNVNIKTGYTEHAQIAVQKLHYYLMGGYVLDINPFIKFKPTTLLKITEGAPFSIDLNASFLFYEKLWLGGMFRSGDAFATIVSFQFTEQLRAGYSFDYTISKLRQYNSGSHEIILGYDFRYKKSKIRSPRYF
jgi:type IX secretion system PorP/SprF family membrane protein